MNEDERAEMNLTVQNLRYWATITHKLYLSIAKSIKNLDPQKAKESYEKMISKYYIELEDAEVYVQLLDDTLANTTLRNILESSQDVLDSMFKQ